MNKKAKTVLTGVGTAAAGAAALGAASYAATKYLVNVAMDRELPKIRHLDKAKDMVRGSGEAAEFEETWEKAMEALENAGCETVSIRSFDGETLVGHWHPAEQPERIIVAMHGWRSSWARDFAVISEFWHKNSCSVLYAEQRGQNNSGGDYMGFGMIERHDCRVWVDWVNEHTGGGIPIYLAGVSMGATTVLMTAGLKLPDNVHGVMADCGFTSAHEIWKHVVENNLHLSYGPMGRLASEICRRKIQMGTSDCSTLDAMEGCAIPVLFVHGTEDRFVPVEMTHRNYERCTAPKRLLIVPGAGHGMSYVADTEGYQQAMRDFWREFD